uniref:NADH dehydrogenase subunit 4L n=1 Tax=Lynceus grossipedia TaxID=2774322 RepID=UPI0023AA750D|nr:NADH dehydrogenase subunit 4L [Lynceus grossipedia]WCD23727.1 NADH dehydrogenase subunit 4L [Lynceus grossipedia]
MLDLLSIYDCCMCVYMLMFFMFLKYNQSFLSMLIILEFMVVVIYVIMLIGFINMNLGYFFCVVFLVVSVCEGALGLSILVVMVRSFSSDYLSMKNLCLN